MLPYHAARFVPFAVVLTVMASAGCETLQTNTARGAGVGGLLGAGIGTAIGAASGDAGTGALAGSLIGAGVGGIAGADADAQERERADAVRYAEAEATIASQPVRGPLSLEDVVQMSRPNDAGHRMSEDLLIEYIRSTNSRFQLSPGDMQYLSTNGVPDRVIQEMLRAPSTPNRVSIRSPRPQRVYIEEPPVVFVEHRHPWGMRRPLCYGPPVCPPPIGFGFTWVNRR